MRSLPFPLRPLSPIRLHRILCSRNYAPVFPFWRPLGRYGSCWTVALTRKGPRVVTYEVPERQNRRHVTEKTLYALVLSVPHPPSLRQPFLPSCSSPENSAVVSSQGKRRSHMHLPPPTVIRYFRSDLDQPFDQPRGPSEGKARAQTSRCRLLMSVDVSITQIQPPFSPPL